MSEPYFEQWATHHLEPGPPSRWRQRLIGGGALMLHDRGARLVLPQASQTRYSNAQLDDYDGLPHRRYPWHPPLRLHVRACFGGPLLGTAGFGFWNHPFSPVPVVGGTPLPPRAIWFFHTSPPNDIAIAHGVPGHGWKAATLDTLRPSALRWGPLAPAVVLLNQWPTLERRIWSLVERDLRISEALIDASTHAWHDYVLEWRTDGARFTVDGRTVMETDRAPRGPLGFVAWVDNQYAIATRWGRLGYGLLQVSEPQWLDLQSVAIEPL